MPVVAEIPDQDTTREGRRMVRSRGEVAAILLMPGRHR
jgi:hypothetical protein